MSSICVGCGLCCDGSMFHATDLAPHDERLPLEALGAVFVIDEVSTRFEQPCPAQMGGCCTVYEQRPTRCRSYDCALVHQLNANAISEAEAQAIVAQAVVVRSRVHAELAAIESAGPRLLGSQHLAQRVIRAQQRFGTSPELERVAADVRELQTLISEHFTVRATHQ